MNNEELKKKIVEIIRYCYVNEKDYGYIFDLHIEEKINAIADALIAAGIGDVYAAVREFAEKLKEKVLTLILKELKVKTIEEARVLSVIDSLIVGDALYDDIENIFNKAEKELAEEGKDD